MNLSTLSTSLGIRVKFREGSLALTGTLLCFADDSKCENAWVVGDDNKFYCVWYRNMERIPNVGCSTGPR